MTDFDEKLIEVSRRISMWDYQVLDTLARYAESAEAKEKITDLRWDLHDAAVGSL